MKRLFLIYPVIVSAIVLLFTTACKKEEPATKPSLSTTPVTNITTVTATSGGIIANDGGASITANGACWGTTDNPTISDSKTTDGVSTGQFVSNLAGLTAGTTYHVRSYATNSVGTSYGADMSFLTLGQAPSGLTQTPTNITATGATLNGTVNPNDLSTTVTFEYGTTTSYGSTATASQSPVTGNTIKNVSADISGLLSGTTYHFRVKTVNSIGTTYGDDKTFITIGQAPTAITQAACCLSSTGATLNGAVNANNLSTTVTFEYGTTTSYGQTVTAAQSPVIGNTNTSVSASITGLTSSTIYHFRIKSVNSVGTTYGSDMSFTTSGQPPLATTFAATNIKTTGVTLNGSVDANNLSTTVTFEYGTTTSYGSTATATQSPIVGNTLTNVSASITGLTAGTTYHFSVKAVNSVGTTYGNDMTFTTIALPPTNGLVGYWSFSGNANDESVNAHNGTVSGASLTPSRFGTENSAYSFDGVNDYIAIAPSSLVDNETAITVSCWLKRGAADDYGLPYHTGNQGRVGIQVKKDSVLINVTTNSTLSGGTCSTFTIGWVKYNQTEWSHIILRYDGTSISLYINGEFIKSTYAEGNIWTPQSSYLAFGVYMLFGNPNHGYYKGILDDVRLYNRALNATEIQSLYHEGGW
jgi:YHS domain-containing protein